MFNLYPERALLFMLKLTRETDRMKRILILILLIPFQQLTGQELMNRDSLLRLLPKAKADSNKVLLFIHLGQQYENQEPEIAKYYYQSAGELSRQINYLPGRIRFAMNYTYVLNQQGLFDSSLLLNLESVRLARELGDNFMLAKTLFNTGSSYRLKEDYSKAVQYYEEGKRLFEPYKNEAVNAQAYDILQNLYTGMKQYRRSLEYGRPGRSGFQVPGEPDSVRYRLQQHGTELYLS
jgi:two-component system, NarL family, sensor kinase